ncbi:MAG: SRPBCC family protein [Chitinophagaceae bacterium]
MKNKLVAGAGIQINAPVVQVWEALTTPSIIKQYLFGTEVVSAWKLGTPIVFKSEWQGKFYEDKGIILDKVPLELLRYSFWSSLSGIEDKPENYFIITNELITRSNQTLLTVTQENIADEKTKQHAEQNWNKVLACLKKVVDQKPAYAENLPY